MQRYSWLVGDLIVDQSFNFNKYCYYLGEASDLYSYNTNHMFYIYDNCDISSHTSNANCQDTISL